MSGKVLTLRRGAPMPIRPDTKTVGDVEAQMTRLLLIGALLARRNLNIFRTLKTVSVSFASEIEAEEFAKLLRGARRGAR